MSIKNASLVLLILAAVILGTAGCTGAQNEKTTPTATSTPPPAGKTVSGNGTMVELLGGSFGIYGDDQVQYLPEVIGAEFMVNGLRVSFSGTVGDFTKEMGTPIHLTSIQKLPEEISNVTGEDFYRGFRDIPPPHINQTGDGSGIISTGNSQPPNTNTS